MDHRTSEGFPLYMSLHDAGLILSKCQNASQYTIKMFELLIKQTPFKQKDIYALHRELQENAYLPYSESTIKRRMFDLRKDGSIRVLDGNFTKKEDRVFEWTLTPNPPKPKLVPRTKSVFGKNKSHDDKAALRLYTRCWAYLFS